jgi:hypothetical protein
VPKDPLDDVLDRLLAHLVVGRSAAGERGMGVRRELQVVVPDD